MSTLEVLNDSFRPRAHRPAQVVLVGNPNTGKTTLFNALTGLKAKTANYPGITVDLRRAELKFDGIAVDVVDLPGLYSLHAVSPEEKVAAAALRGEVLHAGAPDLVVLVLDATHLTRNLFLASEVLELRLPTLIALNQVDAADAAQIRIEISQLEQELKCSVIPVSARTGAGLDELRHAVSGMLTKESATPALEHKSCISGCTGCTFAARFDWAERVTARAVPEAGIPGRRTDTIDRILTNPIMGVAAFLTVMLGVFYLIFSLATVPMDMVDSGFGTVGRFVDQIIPGNATHGVFWKMTTFSVSMLVFAACYRTAGVQWSRLSICAAAVVSCGVMLLPVDDFRSLLIDGVIGGVSGVVIFLPQICILFFFISLLEDSGYMARAAFVMERLMRFAGLPGKAFVPMLSAHACAIPGIMAARVIENWRDRLVTILVLPLLTCSARLPVYAMVTALLFHDAPLTAAMVFVGAYVLGIVAALFSAFCLKKTILKGEAVPLVIELPPYRAPSLRNALATVLDRGTVFVQQAGTVILMISVILWALATFPRMSEESLDAEVARDISALRAAAETAEEDRAEQLLTEAQLLIDREALASSFAGRIGRLAEPVFRPLGFDWKINVGVISSFAAREVVVSTLAIVYGIGEDAADDQATLVETLRRQKRPDGTPVFDTATGMSLLVFFVLAMQCLPTQAVTRRETGSWKWAAIQLIYMTALAYVAAFAVYQTVSRLS